MSDIFVGKVVFAHGDWARIEPLAALRDGRWQKIENRIRDFPDEGLAFVPPGLGLGQAQHGSLWTFRREANVKAISTGKDRFVATQAEPAVVIIDLSMKKIEDARVALYDEGVELPNGCSDRIIVGLSGGLYCVLQCEQEANSVRRIRPSSTKVNLMTMPLAWLDCGKVEGRRILPMIVLPQSPAVRRVNWCSDADFVERVLLRTRKHLRNFGGESSLPGKETLQRIARALEQQELLQNSDDDVEFDMERLQSQWPRLLVRFKASDAMCDLVLESDLAIEFIEEARREAAEKEAHHIRPLVEAQVREALKEEILNATAEKDLALSAVRGAERRHQELTTALEILEVSVAEATAKAREAEEKVRAGIRSLEQQLTGLSPKEVPFARAFLSRLATSLGDTNVPQLPDSAPPWSAPRQEQSFGHICLPSLPDLLRTRSKIAGLSSLTELDAFARAGELVLLTGQCIERTLETYADCIAAGQIWTMTVDPSIIGMDDLWASPPERSPTPLAMAWTFAERNPGSTVLLCLRAIDASPMHLWLSSFAALLRSRSRPRNLIVLAIPIGVNGKVSNSEYPGCRDLLKWIVPIRTTQEPGGSINAIPGLSKKLLSLTSLKWSDDDSFSLEPDFILQLSRVDGDSVVRAARLFKAVYGQKDLGRLVTDWISVLSSAEIDPKLSWLSLEDLKKCVIKINGE